MDDWLIAFGFVLSLFVLAKMRVRMAISLLVVLLETTWGLFGSVFPESVRKRQMLKIQRIKNYR